MTAAQERGRLLVIGGGPGGYPAAFHAADRGWQVTMVDPEPEPGGVCLYRGCIPSKALLHAAKVMEEAREAGAIGVRFAEPGIDLDRLRAWKDSVVGRLTGGLGGLRRQRGVRFLRGRARFRDGRTAEVTDAKGAVQAVGFDRAIVATGSRPASIPGLPASPRVMDSTGALALEERPARMLVVGGGYIGLELGSVYAALGTKVTVVEMLPGLLPGADRDLVRPLAARLSKRFEAIRLETRVNDVREEGDALAVTMSGPDGRAETQTFDRVLVSVGRRPNAEDIGLDRAGVETGAGGFIGVNPHRATSAPGIYAVGDVAGEPMLAHKATHEARVAAEAIGGAKTVFEPRGIPAVVFTDPEIAWVGLTEAEAAAAGRPVKVARFPWSASGRALTLERQEGLTKLVVDPGSGRVLGAGLCGVGVGDLVAEAALALEMGATAEDLALTIHPHPTLSETMMEAADGFLGHGVHLGR